MTDLAKLLSDSSVSAQQAAEKLASPCLEAIKKNEDAAKIEGKFDGLWSSVLSAAEQTPHDKQGKLVETLHAIKSIPQSAETAKKVVVWGEEKRWDELPMFGGKAREQLDIAQEKSDEAFVNINGFFARATAAGVDDLSLFAIWTLREALEDPAADKISETSPKLLKASSVWFIYAADALAKASKDGKQFDGKVAKPGASLTEFKDEPDIRLAQAVSEFEAALTAEQKITFRASRTAAISTAPTMSDVMRLTAEMDLKATSKHGRIRCFGPRLTNMLQAIQQFAALGDIVVGGSQNLIACGVWSAARMTVHVMTGYLTHLEKLSVLFMTVGRNAPRYQAMAAIYPKSKNLQRYLCEYFIIVTKLCYELVTWVQKPALNRISTSLKDPDMKSFQADLDTWSASIKEEADFLLSQRFQEEAKVNATFRSIISYRSEYIHHRQKMDRSIRFLDACSQHDYRTTWKQTRKRGTTRTLPSYSEYQKWKSPPHVGASILFRGKLGAGKSVLLANIIDDLNLLQNAITLYFFARHDTPDSLSSRTIFGSLARQLLESFANDSRFDHMFAERVSQLDLNDIVEIFRTIPFHGRPVYIVVDGLNECSTEEQENVLRCLSSIEPNGYKICISVRTPIESPVWVGQSFGFDESIPEENQDISDFVQAEVDQRELIDGACGMFLWVALQLDSICSEISDNAIREAIRDLPRDLTQTYERNLLKPSSSDFKGYHIRIFKLLVGTREPLTTEQLREAASIKTGHTIWSPQQHISNIQAVLRFCGCLVMVDEEDDTVRFIHHSARSFCLNSPRNAAEWTFTEKEANLAIAETLVTYLSYNVFDTRLSKNVVPKIDANSIPAKVALSTMTNRQVGSRVTNKLFRLKTQVKQNIGPTLAEIGPSYQESDVQEFFLLSYAKSNWIRHTSQLESLPSLPHWYHLLDHATFGIKSDDIDEPMRQFAVHTDSNIGLFPFNTSLYAHPRMIWAIFNGHILILRHEIIKHRGVKKLQAFATLCLLLMKVSKQALLHQLDYHLARWLCLMFIRLGKSQSAKTLLLRRLSASNDCFVEYAREAIFSSDSEAFTFFLNRFTAKHIQQFKNSPHLTEWAISSGNAGMLCLLVRKGLATDPIVNGRGINQALKLDFPDEVKFRLVHCLFRNDFDLDVLGEDGLYSVIQLFRDYACLENVSNTIRKLLASSSRISSRKQEVLLRMASIWERCDVKETLLHFSTSPDASRVGKGCLDIALHGPFADRLKLIWTLLQFGAQPTTETVDRALERRYWNLASYFLTRIEPNSSKHYFNSATSDDSAATIDSFLANAKHREDLHNPITQHCQFHLCLSYDGDKYQFYFGPPSVGDRFDHYWEAVRAAEARHSQLTTTQAPGYARTYDQSLDTKNETTLAVEVAVFMLDLKNSEQDQTPCLRLTTPNSLDVISEVATRWQSASLSLDLLNTDENSVMLTHYENYYPIWDSISRNGGLGRWLLPDSFWDTPKIRQVVEQRRYLMRRQVEDAHRGLHILNKCISLLLILHGSTEEGFGEGYVPSILPERRWFPDGLSSDLTYMGLRIQWLRALRAMFDRGFLTKSTITEQLLVEMGSMAEVLPGMIEMYKGLKHRLHHHKIMPRVLEAAFLGAEGREVLAGLLHQMNQWTIGVCYWIETVDTEMFMLSMGENAPLSFARAFQSFREVGATDEDMEMLEQSLDVARGKVPELE
ncbi:heterokaryon incompatibility protein het-E-1 [Fusarium denticulatum]|uniref:Heterokaryon incompatibility protein het-E-1 n=1 Tax=Fusarium denticulatum TaxID=48507 RepID=A0A8H5X7C1_9HYPO|nr:heterokaryon incompatibility protein het-E-1 [Fusarium denticulatum]